MAVQITDRKFLYQWDNGTTFASNLTRNSTNLRGVVGIKVKMTANAYSTQVTEGTGTNPYFIKCDVNGLYNILERNSGSWIADGFKVGDVIYEVFNYNGTDWQTGNPSTPTLAFSGTILTVSASQITLTAAVASSHAGTRPNNAVIGVIQPVYLGLNFGFVENSDTSLNYNSPYSNDVQRYVYDAISSTTVWDMVAHGGSNANKNWNSGSATVAFVSSDDPLAIGVNYRHKFSITHTFIINPFYLEEFRTHYENGTLPDNFIANKSIKPIYQYEFRTEANNSNTDIVGYDNSLDGDVNWLDETTAYSVVVDSYEDSVTAEVVDALQSKRKTTVSGTITGTGFTNTHKAGFYLWHNSTEVQYQVNQGSLQDAFLYDSVIATMVAGTVTVSPSGLIKRFKLDYVSSTELTFEADIELTTDQQEYIGDEKYFIGVQIGNISAGTDPSVTPLLTLDYQPWTVDPDVTSLATFEGEGFLLHNQSEVEAGYSDYKGWKQDGTYLKATLVLNKTLEANLKGLKFQLIAFNTAWVSTSGEPEYFELQNYTYNLNNVVIVNATPHFQRVDTDTTRNFKLASGDYFNKVSLVFNDIVGTTQDINIGIGFKFDWQSWVKNKNADTIFTDTALDSNGLGNDASRYSLNENYEIRARIVADINQYDSTIQGLTSNSTEYCTESPALEIHDYNEDGNVTPLWSALVQTFNTNGDNLSGVLDSTADTRVRITWTPQSGVTTGFEEAWAIHRIELLNAVGYGSIDEHSSIRTPLKFSNLLKPLAGQTYTKITDNGTTIITECLVDYTKLVGVQYNLYGRLGNVRIYGRYGYAKDFKFLNSAKTEAISFSYNGFPVESNSLRLCSLDADYNVFQESVIEVDATYEYEYMKLAVDPNETANGKRVFYMIGYGASDLVIFRYVYNGTIYQKTLIHSETATGAQPPILRIDPVLSPNSRAFIWFGNLQIDVNAGGRGLKTLYWNGASYVVTDVEMYDAGISNTPENPIDINFYDGNIFIMNYDPGTSTTTTNQERGKIGLWTQTGGSTTSPTDRSNFANYTYGYDLYLNATDHKNVNGVGNVGDMAYAWGFEISEIDANDNPIFVSTCNANTGALGRHFVRIRANIASPTTSAHWTIENPMAFINGTVGDMVALSGTASATATSTPQNYRYSCHLAIIDGNTFIAGMDSEFHWMKYTINSWTGASNNSWYINAPFDPNYNFTSGNILTR